MELYVYIFMYGKFFLFLSIKFDKLFHRRQKSKRNGQTNSSILQAKIEYIEPFSFRSFSLCFSFNLDRRFVLPRLPRWYRANKFLPSLNANQEVLEGKKRSITPTYKDMIHFHMHFKRIIIMVQEKCDISAKLDNFQSEII